jgi:Protein of unknown function (DUF5132)
MAKEHRQAPPTHAEAPVSSSKAASNGGEMDNIFGSKLATVAAVGIGVALIEAELIPGMLIGIGAMLAPNLLNRLGSGLRPLVKGAVRAGYALVEQTKETMAEASEQYQDIVAEVHSEQHSRKHA